MPRPTPGARVAQKTSYKSFAEKVPGGKELIEKALSVK